MTDLPTNPAAAQSAEAATQELPCLGARRPGDRPRHRRLGSGGALRVLRVVLRTLWTLLVTAFVLAVLAVGVARTVYDMQFMPILTPSMTPVMPAGSLAVTQPVAAEDIKTGDIIAFRPPPPWTPKDGKPVVHRVARDDAYAAGRVIQTKGDANDDADPWKIDLSGPGSYARVVHIVPGAGRAAQAVAHVGPVAVAGAVAGLFLMGWGLRRLLPRRRRSR